MSERGDAVFRIQFFQIRAVQHKKRIVENREMDKRNLQYDVAALKPTPGWLSGCASSVLWFAANQATTKPKH